MKTRELIGENSKAYKQENSKLTDSLGVGVLHHVLDTGQVNLNGLEVLFLSLQLLLRLLQLAAKLPLRLGKLLPCFFNLGVASADGCLQGLGVLRPSLDQLILELGGFFPLGLELALVLGGKLILRSYNPKSMGFVKRITSEKKTGQRCLPLSTATWAARSSAGASGRAAAQKKLIVKI
jgi:hypothetical protein